MRRCKPIADRFWPKVQKTDDCWLWNGATNSQGYPQLGAGRRGEGVVYAHRLSYELANGPIPEGLVIDHLCRTPSCVNPAHLEAVGQSTNILRGRTSALRER